MIIYFLKHRRKTAFILVLVLTIQILAPLKSFAITSGPSQPEMHGFQAIGSNDMVDLFTGDFKYNIPLLDVGGYPVNLAYSAGSGVEDESSWVGSGWSLNPGTVNRQMKALPDDFNGDEVQKEVHIKDKIKIGVEAEFKPDLFGWEIGKKKKNKSQGGEQATNNQGNPSNAAGDEAEKLKGLLGFKLSLSKDNYYGWNAGVGVNASLDLNTSGGGKLTTGLGLSSSSRDGVSPSVNLSYTQSKNQQQDLIGTSLGFDYNSRQGMQSMSFGISYNSQKEHTSEDGQKTTSDLGGSASYVDNGIMTYTPTVDVPRRTDAGTMSFHFGVELFGVKGVMGIDGSYSRESIPVKLRSRKIPAFGYLYAHQNANENQSEALVDMNREKDVPYFKGTPVIPIPVLTNDVFMVTSQNGSGQFKLFRNGSGIGHDSYSRTNAESTSLGFDIGAGNMVNLGGQVYHNEVFTVTTKWNNNNYFRGSGDYKAPNAATPRILNCFFKKTGEMTESDESRSARLGGERAVKIAVGKGSLIASPAAYQQLQDDNKNIFDATQIESSKRDKRTGVMTYLTAHEAMRYGLDKYIYSYTPVIAQGANCSSVYARTKIPRVTSDRKGHHVSEITVLDNQGSKMVYGIPVYNMYQEEVTFNVSGNTPDQLKGQVGYNPSDTTTGNTKGRDQYFSKDIMPPYATSFLLTGILSPDYRDLKNDGITDDDYGNAVKFNYTKLADLYKWRTPYETNKANYNRGLYADPMDDKGNYTYGEKEIWYMHSIESKTLIAVFYLNNDGDATKQRKDGLGVANTGGGQGSTRLRYLDSIALYSKPDLKLNGSNATPIKVVHFVYDYSIANNPAGTSYPNSTATGGGKLTLKQVYFTYGKNSKGVSEPYVFTYKQTYGSGTVPTYKPLETDRWGTFKPASTSGLTNAEFPYTEQSANTDEYAGLWNLEQIRLPSGGLIKVNYESDDYAYVQNKRACQMFKVAGINTRDNQDGFINATSIVVSSNIDYSALPDGTAGLTRGLRYLYGKFYVRLRSNSSGDVNDYIPGYAEIDGNATSSGTDGNLFYYTIPIKQVHPEGLSGSTLINPFAEGAWQYLRNNLPQYAYPGYDNGTAGVDDIGQNIEGAIRALGTSILNLKELFENYNHKFYRLNYANHIDKDLSWVRLIEPTGKRKGGGHRVKKITINDNWGAMGSSQSDEYGQMYDYTIQEDGHTISSGVASYEPGIGGDENPFRVPVFYSKKVKWGLDYNTYVEEPVGESYMPAPSVGYRKVTVKSFGASNSISGTQSENKIGYTVNEFYTAKEFPTIIDKTGPNAFSFDPKLIISLVVNLSRSNLVTTQGVSVVQNDMHGKPKSVKTYDKGNYLLSSVEYSYKTKDKAAEVQELNNEVDLLRSNGTVNKGVIGEDVEIYSDMREQHTINAGLRVGVYTGATSYLIVLPFGGINIGGNASYTGFNSASTVKIISRYGVLESTTKMENGSTATTQNLMWDGETGEVLLTKTNNEHEKPVYNLTYPAHWVYESMGPAYQNIESVLSDVSTDANGSLGGNSANNLSLMHPGDELIDISGDNLYWVISDNSGVKYLIDRTGAVQRSLIDRVFKIHYSGRRNLSSTGVASIVSLQNPIVNGVIDVNTNTQVLDAKAVVYSDEWGMPVANTFSLNVESGCANCDCFKQFLFSAMSTRIGNLGKPGLFATMYDNESAGTFMQRFDPNTASSCFEGFFQNESAFENSYYKSSVSSGSIVLDQSTGIYRFNILNGDQGSLGGRKVTYQFVSSQFNDLINNPGGSTYIANELFNNCKYKLQVLNDDLGCYYNLFYDANADCGLSGRSGSEDPGSMAPPCSITPSGTMILSMYVQRKPVNGFSCADPVSSVINPYFIGVKGTWKPLQSYVYQVNRINTVPGVSSGSSNITNQGYFSSFDPFVQFNSAGVQLPLNGLGVDRWVWSQKSKYFTTRGEELESEDALHRFTSAIYGYKQTLPVAVAKNARHLSIDYDGFEDYYFGSNGLPIGSCAAEPCALYSQNGFYFKNKTFNSNTYIDQSTSHSGKFSLKMMADASINLNTALNNDKYASIDNNAIVTRNGNNEYLLNNNYLGKGFTPEAGKDYILSFWVKDPKTSTPSFAPQIEVKINSVTQTLSTQQWPFVEGWKRIELKFNTGISANLSVDLKALANINIDDVRVYPVDAQIKTFAYDAVTQRLMAELDENNFATFYEYNDEGTLIRVKKETERGIMTIKESRQYIIKYNQ